MNNVFKNTLILISLVGSFIFANDMPNICSKDINPNEFTILSYHEISNKSETLDQTYAVTPTHFEEQMHWLVENGYHFVSIDNILNYKKYGKPLPSKAVLVTFDDGYYSVYENAFPIIKKYKIPTVIALVGEWLNAKRKVDFNGQIIARNKFLSQKEIKEMISSGLVEIGSHTFGLHKGIQGNPQGNTEPAVTTRQWLPNQHKYEDEKSYERRVYNDLLHNNIFLKQYTGQKPRVIVWPYGHYNVESRKIAERLNMPIGLTLDDGSNTHITPLWGLKRILVERNMTIEGLKREMWSRNANLTDDDRTTKAAHIDLDYIYDPDPKQQEKNLGDLIDRIIKLGINTVYLQAFADPDANGAADYVYFPNRNVPMRADLFNRVAWQIETRTQVKRVYAWMPMLAWQLPKDNIATKDTVVTLKADSTHLNMGYPRLSPFSPNAQKIIKQIYEDLGKSAYIDGILFHDDVTLSDYEDDSIFAHNQYKKWGMDENVTQIRSNRAEFEKWTKLKTEYLDDFAMQLAKILRSEQPGLKVARNLYAQVALNNNAQEWYAQNLAESIQKYDYTAIMAMPYMEQADNSKQFYDKIIKHVKQKQCGMERTVIELQTVDWRKNSEPISTKEINDTISYLYSLGVHHIAYYPDNLYKNNPDADMIKHAFMQKSIHMHNLNTKQ